MNGKRARECCSRRPPHRVEGGMLYVGGKIPRQSILPSEINGSWSSFGGLYWISSGRSPNLVDELSPSIGIYCHFASAD